MIMNYLGDLYDSYDRLMKSGDERLSGYPMMDSPFLVVVALAYFFWLCRWGPRIMAKRKPFQLRTPLVVYNLFMTAWNAYIFVNVVYIVWKKDYLITRCQPIDFSYDYHEHRMAIMFYHYLLTKVAEFGDTTFFVLRKKYDQLTFLHKYHHSSMLVITWIITKYAAGGGNFYGITINTAVHVIMYSYYAMAAMGPRFQRFLWWKKYITIIQLLQFEIVLAVGISGMMLENCDFPRWVMKLFTSYMVSFLILFGNFYYQAYMKEKRLPKWFEEPSKIMARHAHAEAVASGAVVDGADKKKELTNGTVHKDAQLPPNAPRPIRKRKSSGL